MEQNRFLGVRWAEVWEAIAKPWRNASDWRWVRALTPPATVRLQQADGQQTFWSVRLAGGMEPQTGISARTPSFAAIELPQAMVLYRKLNLPVLDKPELERAVALDAVANSPFPPGDICWSPRFCPQPNGQALQVELALASRSQIKAYLATLGGLGQDEKHSHEVWAPSAVGGAPYFVMPGFDEGARMSRQRVGRVSGLAMVGIAGVLLALIAITPTLQLRARAIEAVHAYTVLHEQSRAAVASREALVRAADQVQWIERRLNETLDPAATLNLLTRVLTDDTSITSLRITGRKILLEGQTTNAAELMQLLGRQPGFQDVVAPVAATRPFGGNKDIFKIEFVLNPEQINSKTVESMSGASSAEGRKP